MRSRIAIVLLILFVLLFSYVDPVDKKAYFLFILILPISLLTAYLSTELSEVRRNKFFKENVDIEKENYPTSNKIAKLFYGLKTKTGMNIDFKILNSKKDFAVSYQTLFPYKNIIRVSSQLSEDYSNMTLKSILAHELYHSKNKDSLRSLVRLIGYIFVMTLLFSFDPKIITILIPLLFFLEISKVRAYEYEADEFAERITSTETILNGLIDFKIKEEIDTEKTSDGDFKKIKIFYKKVLLSLKNVLGSHPSWDQRIFKILDKNQIRISKKDFNKRLKKLILKRKKEGFKRKLDLSFIYPFKDGINW